MRKRLPGIASVRGVIAANDINRIFATAINNQLVIIDATTLTELARAPTGKSPDGLAWDSVHQIVGVSDQGDGALSLIAGAGLGARKQVSLGVETGNVTLSAERVGLAKSGIYKRRARDPGFDRMCRDAIAAFDSAAVSHSRRLFGSGSRSAASKA